MFAAYFAVIPSFSSSFRANFSLHFGLLPPFRVLCRQHRLIMNSIEKFGIIGTGRAKNRKRINVSCGLIFVQWV